MKVEIQSLSNRYTVRSLTEPDMTEVLGLCQQNKVYYKHYKAQPKLSDLVGELGALPPGKTLKDKYFVGFYEGERLVAILDLIDGYPQESVAYIGWFMLDVSHQGHGEGTAIINQILAYLSGNFDRVDLAYIKGNPQAEHFWSSNGFSQVGDEVVEERFSLIKMSKGLDKEYL